MRSHRTASPARSRLFWWFAALSFASLHCPSTSTSPAEGLEITGEQGRFAGRFLLEFQEKNGNDTFQCSPSSPCLPCQYSEKKDNKYRCSETGYRVAIKCVKPKETVKEQTKSKHQRRLSSINQYTSTQKQPLATITNFKWRKLLDDSSEPESGDNSYIIYRSCVPIDREERLSVLGFEIIMVGLLLVSGPVVYMRQRRTVVMPGAGFMRIPANAPRF